MENERRAEEALIAEQVKALAVSRGLGLGALERAIGEKQGYWASVARGERPLRFDRLLRALETLEIYPGNFFAAVWPARAATEAVSDAPVTRTEFRAALDDILQRLEVSGAEADGPPREAAPRRGT